jgi:hypothetical protein
MSLKEKKNIKYIYPLNSFLKNTVTVSTPKFLKTFQNLCKNYLAYHITVTYKR